MKTRIERIIQNIKDRHDPDCELVTADDGQIIYVTWADKALLNIIEVQQARIEKLEARVNALDEWSLNR